MGEPIRVLIVDDEEIITDILKRRFERIGFEVFTAYNGEKAINLLRENPVDLIICDVKIPEPPTAADVFRAARNSYPNARFVVISGSLQTDSSVQSLLQAGASLFIKKPFDSLNSVTSAIIKILN